MPNPHLVGLQMDLAWEDAARNCQRAEALLETKATPENALVVLPEMFASGFSMNAAEVAEPPNGESELWLSRVALRRKAWMVAGLARRNAAGEIGNDAVVIDPNGRRVATYRKQRLFSPGGEHQHYTAGRQTVIFEWAGLRAALFICYDLRFPEIFRVAARERPELYVVIASWPDKRIGHWLKLLQARAIENQAYAIGVNRVGDDPSHHYPGRSIIVNPWGEIIADAGDTEGVIESSLDLASLREYREKLPFLSDLQT